MRLTGLEALEALPALEELSVSQSKADDFGPLRRLTRVERLNAFALQAPEYSWLAGMTGLRAVVLASSTIVDLSPLAGLVHLEELSIERTQKIQDLLPLARLTALKSLNVDDSLVSDLRPLAGLPALESLSIGETRVTSLAPLAKVRTLKFLEARGAPIADLGPVAKLPALAQIQIPKTRVKNLAPLAGLDLHLLDVGGTAVTSVKPLLQQRGLLYLRVPAAVPQAELHALKAQLPSLKIDVDG